MLKNIYLAAIMVLLSFSVGCNWIKKRSLDSELARVEAQKTSSEQKLSVLKQRFSTLQNQLTALETKIQNRENGVATYIQNHFAAVACMAAVGYSVGKDNVFSKDVNEAINLGSVGCGIAVIFNDEFRSDVLAVVSELNQADTEVKNWKSQINPLASRVNVEQKAWVNEKSVFDALTEKIEDIKFELRQLE